MAFQLSGHDFYNHCACTDTYALCTNPNSLCTDSDTVCADTYALYSYTYAYGDPDDGSNRNAYTKAYINTLYSDCNALCAAYGYTICIAYGNSLYSSYCHALYSHGYPVHPTHGDAVCSYAHT